MKLIKLWEADFDRAYEFQNTFVQDENGFINAAYGFSREEFQEYVKLRKQNSEGVNLPEGFVPDTVYLLETEGEYVGIFNIRHRLTEGLIHGAGHIGYGISPKYRGKGYAAKGLEMLLEIARKIVPEEEIYLSVHKDNLASLNVQKKNGAYIHHENEAEYFTRIPLKR